MNIHFKGNYLSLSDFEWNNISNLSILTGENGSGKTQMLTLLFNLFHSPFDSNDIRVNLQQVDLEGRNMNNFVSFSIENYSWLETNCIYWQSHGKHLPNNSRINYSVFKTLIQWLYYLADPQRKKPSGVRQDHDGKTTPYFENNLQNSSGLKELFSSKNIFEIIFPEIVKLSGKETKALKYQDFICHLPLDLIFKEINLKGNDLIEAYIFLYYMKKLFRERYKLETEGMGKSPILIINEILKTSGLKYELLPFKEEEYRETELVELALEAIPDFELKLKQLNSNNIIDFGALSAGEKIIVSVGLLEYHASHLNNYPSIILFDEVDAHLHPSLLPNFFRVVKNILIDKCGATVFMSTHNPSTIALAPKESKVFVMNNKPKVTISEDTSPNRINSINILTEGLLVVNEATKYVFVEDEDDVEFYKYVNALTGASKNTIFIPASNRIKNEQNKIEVRQDGGKNAVENWVSRFTKFSEIFSGLIDKDSGNATDDLNVLHRYSIENYLCDPIVLFSFLNSCGEQHRKPIEHFNILPGTEIQVLNDSSLVNNIAQFMFNKLGSVIVNKINSSQRDSCELKEQVAFKNHITLEYPNWLISYRGKDIYSAFQEVFKIRPNNQTLFRHFNQMGMIPTELFEKLKNLK